MNESSRVTNNLEKNYSRDEKGKKRKKKKRKKKNLVLRFFIIIGVVVGGYYVTNSALFHITEIDVTGNIHYTKEQIIEKSQVKIGANIIKLDSSKIVGKMIKDPYIKNVKIKRKLPKKIIIEIIERKEIATIKTKNGYCVIDASGIVLRNVKNSLEITEITGFKEVKNKKGKPLEVLENTKLNETLKMIESMQKSKLKFEKINAEDAYIRAYIYEQLVCYGTPQNIKNSIDNKILQGVLNDLFSKGIKRGEIKIGEDDYCSFNPGVE